MRTRKSNRAKRYTVEKYDFEGSSDEEALKRTKKADENDDNFDAAAAEESAEEDAEENESEGAQEVSEPDDVPDRFQRQRVKPIRPFNVRAIVPTGYLDVEPVAADGRIVRAYFGPYDRAARGAALVDAWYGRHERGFDKAQDLLGRYMDWKLLPPKTKPEERDQGLRDKGVWAPDFFEREAHTAEQWYEQVQQSMPSPQSHIPLMEEESLPYRFGRGTMPVLLGPDDKEQEAQFSVDHGVAITQSGLPYHQDESPNKVASGWMFDTGGIVTSMDWAPQHNPGDAPQLLALCVIPHSDQEYYDYEQESSNPDFQRHGAVQLWEFVPGRAADGTVLPSDQPPRLRKTLCLDFGRVKRLRWSPACGFLALLCTDGKVHVIQPSLDGESTYERIQEPVSSFGLPDEETVKPTALTWCNFNRLVVGYSDGSIALWSIRPNRLLSRHPVHHNHVLNLTSGYPSMPYVIASAAVGGTVRLLDLRNPSVETTEVQALTVATQPNLMSWSDHLLGFFAMYPASGVLNTQVSFMHHAHYPITRRVYTGESYPSCLSVGRTHPYLLIGSMDGSLFALNPQLVLFSTRREPNDRIKLFQHEHRPARLFAAGSPAAERGASRILQDFLPEKNLIAKAETKQPAKKGKKTKKKEAEGDQADGDEDAPGLVDPSRGIVYEPLTRITAVEWNPNEEYGHWAAVAMGSGLVRVMDLGL